MINWSSFSNQQKFALNTLLDKNATIAGITLPADLKIISLDKARSEDPSFTSRHNISYKSSLIPRGWNHYRDGGVPEQKGEDRHVYEPSAKADATQIDLMGLSDWRQALFGKISLAGETIMWHRSDFYR